MRSQQSDLSNLINIALVSSDVKKFMLKDLSNFVAYLDTGYSKENCQSIIQKMYSKVDFTTQPLPLILIHKVK